MKPYLPTVLALACAVLVIALFLMKRGDSARHESDAGAIADFSNQLDSAQTQIAVYEGRILVFSNSLDASQSASLAFSNQLLDAQSAVALDTEQISNLNLHVTALESDNQTLDQRVMDLTNQMTSQVAALTSRLALTQTNLEQANKQYALLENRFRRDVAERVVVERKFNNLSALKAQLENLEKWSPAEAISDESIYAGLDVEVVSNGFYVISPN